MKDVLPDSRLTQRPDLGTQMVDWELPDGTTVRCEAQPIYCANCGKFYGHVPKENTTFAFYMCQPCFDKYGALAGTLAVPDDEFHRNVEAEMMARFGKVLNPFEIAAAKDQGLLGPLLTLLEKESPFKVPSKT